MKHDEYQRIKDTFGEPSKFRCSWRAFTPDRRWFVFLAVAIGIFILGSLHWRQERLEGFILRFTENPAVAAGHLAYKLSPSLVVSSTDKKDVPYYTDVPRNQTTVKANASNWVDVLPLYKANSTPSDALWMPILGTGNGTDKGGYVYSAFMDSRYGHPFVRVLACVPANMTRFLCKLHYTEKADLTPVTSDQLQTSRIHGGNVVESMDVESQEPYNMNKMPHHSSMFIKCPLPTGSAAVPVSVSIYPLVKNNSNSMPSAGNNIYVHQEATRKVELAGGLPSLAFCSRTVKYFFSDVIRLVEFLELSYIMGGVYFPVYGYSYSKQIECILTEYYMNPELNPDFKLDFFNFELPFWQPHVNNVYLEPETAMNDCFYRSRAKPGVHFVANGDLDEFFMPNSSLFYAGPLGLSKFLQQQTQANPVAGAFQFRRENVLLEFPDDERAKSWSSIPTRVARKTWMTTDSGLFPKLISNVDGSIGLRTHWIVGTTPGFMQVDFPLNIAVCQHYRSWPEAKVPFNVTAKNRVRVESAIPYVGLLEKRVKRFLETVPAKCNVARDLWERDTFNITKIVS